MRCEQFCYGKEMINGERRKHDSVLGKVNLPKLFKRTGGHHAAMRLWSPAYLISVDLNLHFPILLIGLLHGFLLLFKENPHF